MRVGKIREVVRLVKKLMKIHRDRMQIDGVEETEQQPAEDQQHEGRDRAVFVVESWSTLSERTARNAKDGLERVTGARSAGVLIDTRSLLKSKLDGRVDYGRHVERIESVLKALQVTGTR